MRRYRFGGGEKGTGKAEAGRPLTAGAADCAPKSAAAGGLSASGRRWCVGDGPRGHGKAVPGWAFGCVPKNARAAVADAAPLGADVGDKSIMLMAFGRFLAAGRVDADVGSPCAMVTSPVGPANANSPALCSEDASTQS